MLPLLYDSDKVKFMLLWIWLYLLYNLCMYIIFKIMKMFVSKVDKQDRESYIKDDGHDESDRNDGSHERFFDVIDKS